MDTPVFDSVRDWCPSKATAWDLGKRPVPSRPCDVSILDPDTAVVADCDTGVFRKLVREWPDRAAAEEIAEAMHQRDLEQAAQPPVIEVTVTTPPAGIPRLELAGLVQETVRAFTGPQPVLPDEFDVRPVSRGRKMLLATRRARRRAPEPPPLPVSEDDTPTMELPAVREDGWVHVDEVHVP